MAKKATTLHDNLGNDLLPVTNASVTFMDNGTSVQAEINDLKEKTQYNKGHYTTPEELIIAYPNNIENPQLRKGWYAIVGSTDTVWIWDIEGNKWSDSGVSSGGVDSVNGLDGEVILTGGDINATATIDTTSTTKSINGHLNDIYADLENTVDLNSSQLITGTKVFTEVIGLANTSEGTVDQIKHINSNFLITSGTGQNLLNIDEGLETISAFNRELAYEDEIQQIQGDYATKSELNNYLPLTAGFDKALTGTLYATNSGIVLGNNETGANHQKALMFGSLNSKTRIGADNTGDLGIYVTKDLYLRTGVKTDITAGLKMTRDTFAPTTNKSMSLGSSSNYYANIYGTTIYQNGKQVATLEDLNNAITTAIEGDY